MPGGRLQHLGDQVMRGADADAADLEFAGLGLGALNDLGQSRRAKLLAGAKRIDAVAGLADRNEVAQEIDVALRLHRGVGGVRARSLQQRIAVRLGLPDALRAETAGRARHVLDDDGLAERFFHPALRDPHRGIGRPARRERYDDLDRLAGEGLG